MHGKAETKTEGASAETQVAKGTTAGRAVEAHTEAELDFEALDLSIETVEERISPSETNVFDK